MTKEDVIRMAREAGMEPEALMDEYLPYFDEWVDHMKRFAALVAAVERNKLAQWMIDRGYATGHGDTIEDLLVELEWQAKEREREACAKLLDENAMACTSPIYRSLLQSNADAIRARGDT